MMAELRSVREAYGSCAGEIIFVLLFSGRFFFGGQRIDAFGIVHFLAGQRRVEYANNTQRLFAAVQPVFVVLVQGIHHARPQLVRLAVGNGLDGPVAFDAPDCLKMVLVMDVGAPAGKNGGLVKREAHAVLLQQHAAADPGFGADLVRSANHIFHIAYDHRRFPPNFSTWADCPDSPSASATDASMASRPRARCSSSMVSAGSSFSTSSWAPDVSMTTPRLNVCCAMRLASTGSAVA